MFSHSITKATLATTFWPSDAARSWLRGSVLALCGSLFVAICAQIQLPIWPVPVTGQTFAVLVIGMAFGWRLGAATLLLYGAEGAIGLPVFAGLAGGPAVLAGPTAGYILGFVPAAALVGYLAERGWDRNVGLTALAMLAGNLAIYLPGLSWLTLFYAGPGQAYVAAAGASSPLGAAFAAGLLPFLLGDLLKLMLAAAILPLAWRTIARWRK